MCKYLVPREVIDLITRDFVSWAEQEVEFSVSFFFLNLSFRHFSSSFMLLFFCVCVFSESYLHLLSVLFAFSAECLHKSLCGDRNTHSFVKSIKFIHLQTSEKSLLVQKPMINSAQMQTDIFFIVY